LRECIKELHIVFAGFDGSMLMSLVAGIFDETTGKLLFVNAEHPFTVLYRGGTARFLEKELVLHKLGNTFIEKIPLYRVQLQAGDVVIAGSDGRDDILMSDGQMNEEETEFLRRVEEGQGNLQGIYSALQKQGEIMDDLSMIRLKFLKTPA
jgi:serine phosphatase RsbU (regulator of sigma subunit)